MNAATKTAFILLVVAFMLLNPIGACAGSMKAASSPSHACCPKTPTPLTDDCAKPDCVCINAEPVTIAVAANDDPGPVVAMPSGENPQAWQLAVLGITAIERIPFGRNDRFLTFHQILI